MVWLVLTKKNKTTTHLQNPTKTCLAQMADGPSLLRLPSSPVTLGAEKLARLHPPLRLTTTGPGPGPSERVHLHV